MNTGILSPGAISVALRTGTHSSYRVRVRVSSGMGRRKRRMGGRRTGGIMRVRMGGIELLLLLLLLPLLMASAAVILRLRTTPQHSSSYYYYYYPYLLGDILWRQNPVTTTTH